MLHKFVHHNDCLVSIEEVRLSPGQAGFLNGWGVFTTMRIYDGRPFAFERHWRRLSTDAERITLPLTHPPENVLQALRELIQANHVREGCARIYFVYNKIGHWISDEPAPAVDLLMYTADVPKRVGPVQLTVQAHGRHQAHPLSGVKVTSWLQNVWSLNQAQNQGFDEVILLNTCDDVSECTAANIFGVRAEKVITPPISSGCLPGVTRAVLLEIGYALGLEITQTPLKLRDLYESDEVFITSTTREVQAVSRIGDKTFPQEAGPVTRRLAEAFSLYVDRALANQKSTGAR